MGRSTQATDEMPCENAPSTRSLRRTAAHSVEVDTPKEARDAIKAADTLGLTVEAVEAVGSWRTKDGAGPSNRSTWLPLPGGKMFSGREWFEFEYDGERFKAKPVDRSRVYDDNTLRLFFTEGDQ